MIARSAATFDTTFSMVWSILVGMSYPYALRGMRALHILTLQKLNKLTH